MVTRFVEYYYGRDLSKPFPFDEYSEISLLCLRILRRFSKDMLCKARNGQRYSSSGGTRPPESCFQDEFYRCFWKETGSNIGISSEWCDSGQGRIDFLISEPGWGFELLRDGDRLREHCERFSPGGRYHPWIQRGALKDWLILDCRHSVPHTTCKPIHYSILFSCGSTIVQTN